MRSVDYLIIGGGITGLTFAGKIDTNNYVIVEKEDTLGGLCRTHYVGNYVWDYAGHFFHFSNDELRMKFNSHFNSSNIVHCKKNTKIHYKGHLIDYPFQKNIHQLQKEEFIDCFYDLYFKEVKDNYHDFLDMLYGKFGISITDKFLKPYNEKLYACDLKELDTDAMGRFFPYADINEIVKNMRDNDNVSYNTYFDYPKKGAQTIIDILKHDINLKNVMLNSKVDHIDVEKHIAIINGVPISYNNLINTIPFSKFISLYNSPIDSSKLTANKVLVFNIGFDKKTEDHLNHWLYFPESDFCFYRVGFYDNILSSNYGSIYVELGFKENFALPDSYVKDLFDTVICDLKKAKILTNQKVIEYEYLVIDPGYVHITSETNSIIKKEFDRLKEKNIYSIGRYGRWTYCSMEDCMLQAFVLANKIKNNDSI